MEMNMASASPVPVDKPSHGDKPFLEDKPFPFLRLPKELRLMVYDRLSIVTRHHTHLKQWPTSLNGIDSSMTIVTKTVPGVAILATCRLIKSEAHTIIVKKLEDVRSQPTKYIIDPDCISDFCCWRYGVPQMVAEKISGDCARWYQILNAIWEERDPYSENREFTGRPFAKFLEKCANWELKGRPASRDIDAKVEIAINIGGVPEMLTSDQSVGLSRIMSNLPRRLRQLRENLSEVCSRRTVHATIKFSAPNPRPLEQYLASLAVSSSTPETGLTVLGEDAWRDDWAEGAESL